MAVVKNSNPSSLLYALLFFDLLADALRHQGSFDKTDKVNREMYVDIKRKLLYAE